MATYNIVNSIPNTNSGNKTITIVPNAGYVLPSSVSVSGGTLVSYNSSTGVAVVNGDNAVISATCMIPTYLTFSSSGTFTLKVIDNKKGWDGTLQYSTNTTTWNTWDGTTTLYSSSSGATKYLYLRGVGNTYITGSSASSTTKKWVLTGNSINCNGNIETLLDYATVINGQHPPMANYCYYYMFDECTSLVTAPSLPATTAVIGCYGDMFSYCTSLVTAPSLPATTLASQCYYYMFNRCTSLVTAPSLPATTLAENCYCYMFSYCTSLVTAPSLPATTLANSCYQSMFQYCTSLTTPAIIGNGITQLTSKKFCCYSMYNGCTSLNLYTTSTNHTRFYKAMTYSTTSSSTNYSSTFRMFYDCKIDGSTSTANYITAGTQLYY